MTPQARGAAFCVLVCCDVFYSCCYAFMLLRTIVADSAFSRDMILRDAIGLRWAEGPTATDTEGAAREAPAAPGGAPAAALPGPRGRGLFDVLSIPQFQLIGAAELEIERRIGGGGFGDVYLAQWRGAPVAVKRLRVESACDADPG